MKPELILQADVLDIIFENRNKEYGAYVLRKEYARRLFHSLGGVLFVLLAAFAFLNWKRNDPQNNIHVPPIDNDSGIKLRQVELPEPEPRQQIFKKPPPVATVSNPPPVIVPDHVQTDTILTIDALDKAIISDKTTEGQPAGTKTVIPPVDKPGEGGTKPGIIVAPEPAVLEVADVMPEFPGGISGWQRFLQKNLRFPGAEDGLETSIKIVVHVKFVVNEDGSLAGVEIVQSGGKEFDQEVLRVMKKSPKWLAGSDKGRKVKIYRKQPVVFEYNPE